MHIQDENKFNSYQYLKQGGVGHSMEIVFDCRWKKVMMGICRDKKFGLFSSISLFFFEIYQMYLLCAWSMALSIL